MGAEGYLVSPAVFKTVEGGGPALVSSILTCLRQKDTPQSDSAACFFSYFIRLHTNSV